MPLATTTTLSMLFASCKNKNHDTKQNQELQIAKTNYETTLTSANQLKTTLETQIASAQESVPKSPTKLNYQSAKNQLGNAIQAASKQKSEIDDTEAKKQKQESELSSAKDKSLKTLDNAIKEAEPKEKEQLEKFKNKLTPIDSEHDSSGYIVFKFKTSKTIYNKIKDNILTMKFKIIGVQCHMYSDTTTSAEYSNGNSKIYANLCTIYKA